MCWVKSCRSRRAASSSSQARVVSHSFSKAVSLRDKRGGGQGSQGGVLAKGFGNCPLCLQIMQGPDLRSQSPRGDGMPWQGCAQLGRAFALP